MTTATEILTSRFGYTDFRPGQQHVVESLLAGRSALAVFPTGAGKSLCYQLPALMLDGLTVVVSPLIALMKDQIDLLAGQGVDAARLDSSLDANEVRAVSDRLRAGSLKLLYVAPERFNNERFLAQLGQTKIALFAVDEAHCISEWGHNFRPDYLKLAARARELGAERVLALTATATPAVVADIRAGFGIEERDSVVTGFYRPNLTLLTTPVRARERDQMLIDRLRERAPGSTIVYVTLQRTAERVAALLAAAGLPARAYHAGMNADDRVEVQEWWTALGRERGRRDDRVRHGDRQGRRPLRLPLQPAEGPRVVLAGDRPRRARRRAVDLRASSRAATTCRRSRTSRSATRRPPTRSQACSTTSSHRSQGEQFAVSEYELSSRHDIRPLVLKTILTYLELDGFLEQGTPFYAGYSVRPASGEWDDVYATFDPDRADFLRRVLASGKEGRIWTSIDPDAVPGEERERVIQALGYLDQHGLVELKVADVRQRFTLIKQPPSLDELRDRLAERFDRREQSETARIERVVTLVEHNGCQVQSLVGYFGETRVDPCGHCSYCLTGSAQSLPEPAANSELELDRVVLDELTAEHPTALGTPRQRARFLCGLSSPATTKAKLSRHALYGVLAERRFADVLALT